MLFKLNILLVMADKFPQVYLIKEREFKRIGEPVLKLGKTTTGISTRGMGYPKGSSIIATFPVSDCTECENELKKRFGETFRQRKDDVGLEYFEGNEIEMIDMFTNIALKYRISKSNCPQQISINDVSTVEEDLQGEYKLDGNTVTVKKNQAGEYCCEIYKYEDIIKHSNIREIIITNKNTLEGYLRFSGKPAIKLSAHGSEDETLQKFLEKFVSKEMVMVKSTNYRCLCPIKRYRSMNRIKAECRIFVSENDVIGLNQYSNIISPSKWKKYDVCSDPPEYINIELLMQKSLENICKSAYITPEQLQFYKFANDEHLVSINRKFRILKMSNWSTKSINSLPKTCYINYQEYVPPKMIKFDDGDAKDQETARLMNMLITNHQTLDEYRKICRTVFMGNNERLYFEDRYDDIPLLTIWINDAVNLFSSHKIEVKNRNRSAQGYYTVVNNRDSGIVMLSIVDSDNLKLLNDEEKQGSVFVSRKCDPSPYNLGKYRTELGMFGRSQLWFWGFMKYITT